MPYRSTRTPLAVTVASCALLPWVVAHAQPAAQSQLPTAPAAVPDHLAIEPAAVKLL